MALRHKLTKAQYEALSDELKKEYIAGSSDGEYVLDVVGLPEPEDTGPLKRANERLKQEKTDLQKTVGELQDKISAFPDVDKLKAEHAADKSKLQTFTEKTLRDGAASALAAKISTVPALMAKAIAERLAVDMTGDEPKTVVLGADGKPSKLSLDDLSKEFVANPEFKTIIKASGASGGGAPKDPTNGRGGGAPADGSQDDKPADLSRMKGADLAARITAKREARQEQEGQS